MSEPRTHPLWATGQALRSPLAIFAIPRRAAAYLVLYLALCMALLGGVVLLLGAYQGALRHAALGYVLPEGWIFAAELLMDAFLSAQLRPVVVNGIVALSLAAVSLLLFVVKEMVSASYEVDAQLTDLPIQEPPLWEQGWQEIKLFTLFLAVQGAIFWIGYFPSPWAKAAALVLSYGWLLFAFAVDFVSPIFQRHMGYYSQILKTLAAHPLSSLVFGALFSAPVIAAGLLWEANPGWSPATALVVVFGANIASIGWAAVSGTWFGAQILGAFQASRRSGLLARVVTWTLVLAVLAANAYTLSALGLAVHHKSQLLKCRYSVDWGSLDYERPGLSDLLDDRIQVGLAVDVRVQNPNRFKVVIEDNRVEIEHDGARVATTRLPTMVVEPDSDVRQRLSFAVQARPSAIAAGLTRGAGLLDPDRWSITMYVQVTPRFELPIYLLRAKRR